MSRERVRNHPGHSSQKSHGRKGGGGGKVDGEDITASADYEDINSRGMEHLGGYSYADRSLGAIQEAQGFTGKPEVVSRAEFDRAVRAGEVTETHRGIDGPNAQRYAEEFRSGDLHPGTGTYGAGTYVATSSAYLDEFQPAARLRIGLRTDANVVEIGDLRREQEAFARSASPAARNAASDLGRFAALRGYDAVNIETHNDEPQLLILNRTAVIVQEA
ncbi:MAG TPA: hypothetical protein VF174_15610 [Micromonosporaceae bacterium]